MCMSEKAIRQVRQLHTLKNLEVLEVGVFSVDVELDTRHGDIH